MFDTLATLYQFNLDQCRRLVADIREDQMRIAPTPNANPPVWILGHLAIATDYAGQILGLPNLCPPTWHSSFSPGSKPLAEGSVNPSKTVLFEAIQRGHDRVTQAISGFSFERLDVPHGVPFMEVTAIRTTRQLLAHLLSTHESLHLGQLSVCRRSFGLSPLM